MILPLLLSLIAYLATALLSLSMCARSRFCGNLNAVGASIAAVLGFIPVIFVLTSGVPVDFQIGWGFPMGSFHLRMDLLSAWFSVPVLLISALAAIYGRGYMSHYKAGANYNLNWFFYQLLCLGMFLVLIAWDGMLFLFAWEIMSIAAWFLVMFEHESLSVQHAGWVYLAATHLGTAFLFFMFVLMQSGSGSFDFSKFTGIGISANVIFILAVIGFGSKAGFFGLHVWLPEAHPAAPSHVSGLMSGVMIKTGIYGLLRMMTLTQGWSEWWGWLFIAIGVASGLGGVLFALVQQDIKRLLAYCSVENIGIICLGLGLGILGISHHHPVAILGIAGALLHILNHAVFKTVLFMSAGSVVQTTGTRDIDLLGGLQKKMPITSLTFLVAAAAICGLPPLNGFVSEFLIYISAYKIVMFDSSPVLGIVISGFVVITSLALIGGFAVMCFTKVFGIVFLGEARTESAASAKEAVTSMQVPMLILASICILIGLGGYFLVKLIAPVAAFIRPAASSPVSTDALNSAAVAFIYIAAIAFGLFGVFALISLLRTRLLKNRTVGAAPTWGCGYAFASPRMQYTGSSFVEPLTHAFKSLYHMEMETNLPKTQLPDKANFSTHSFDPFMKWFYEVIFSSTATAFHWLRRIQHGRIHVYILYILLALAAIFTWSFL